MVDISIVADYIAQSIAILLPGTNHPSVVAYCQLGKLGFRRKEVLRIRTFRLDEAKEGKNMFAFILFPNLTPNLHFTFKTLEL